MMRHEVLPNLFLIGAPRAGTTMLYGSLAGHLEVFAPAEKEPQHFLFAGGQGKGLFSFRGRQRVPASTISNYVARDAYAALYRMGRHARYRLDGSTVYWAHGYVAGLLAEECPDAKLIVVLREPVARAISHHHFNRARGEEPAELADAVQEEIDGRRDGWWLGGYLHSSRYRERFEPFRRAFGPDRICVLDFDELVASGSVVLARLAAFLDLPPGFGPLRTSNEARAFSHTAAAWLRRGAVRAKQSIPALASVPWAVEGVRWLERRHGRTPPPTEPAALALLRAELADEGGPLSTADQAQAHLRIRPGSLRVNT
jgi:Sulfotransferase family